MARTARGERTSDGAGVSLTRVIGTRALRSIDPFLMLDEFGSDEPSDYLAGFPEHPHRGFETVTYVLAGRFRHRDNQGHEGLLEAGGAQWMTAGRGIVHSEMPEQTEGLVRGFQLWLNLPAAEKMCEPAYRDVPASEVPVASLGPGASGRVLAGTVGGVTGPIARRATAPLFVDVSLEAGATGSLEVPAELEGFAYVFDGASVTIGEGAGERAVERGTLALLGAGDSLRLRADRGPARALVVAGRPLREPVVQYGPFVMNSVEEIEQAIRDFQSGRF